MNTLRTLTLLALVVLLGSGCLGDSTGLPGDVPQGNGVASDGGTVSGNIPCDVAAVISTYCVACHGSPPSQGAPNSLTSVGAFKAASISEPSKTIGQVALERMASTTAPMPPAPHAAVPSSGQATVAAWVNAGMPAGSCGTAAPDAGVVSPGGGTGGSDGGSTPADAGVSGDLPCNIASILAADCTSCHGTPPTNGAPVSLNSLATLKAYSTTHPTETEGQLAITRMAATTAPMPPLPAAPVSSSNQSAFSSWVDAGMPGGTCGAPTPDGGTGGGGPDGGTGDAGTGGGSDAGVSGDLPCDVANLLTGYCTVCHGSPPAGGAPDSLNSLAALTSMSVSEPTKTRAQVCVERMASTTAPMPPPPNASVPAASQASFSAWVDAGTPAGTCGAPTPDGGPPPDPTFSGPPTCTSGVYWTQGNEGSSRMHPGLACIVCHTQSGGDGPRFAVAGTVYPTGHEYDDCDGSAASGAVVTVTDITGVSKSFTANAVGNFYGSPVTGWPVFPITAQVTFSGKVRLMSTAVSSGDCNSCHTLDGANGAPGRIALPH